MYRFNFHLLKGLKGRRQGVKGVEWMSVGPCIVQSAWMGLPGKKVGG